MENSAIDSGAEAAADLLVGVVENAAQFRGIGAVEMTAGRNGTRSGGKTVAADSGVEINRVEGEGAFAFALDFAHESLGAEIGDKISITDCYSAGTTDDGITIVFHAATCGHVGSQGTMAEDVVFIAFVDIAEFAIGIFESADDKSFIAFAIDVAAAQNSKVAGYKAGDLNRNLFAVSIDDAQVVARSAFERSAGSNGSTGGHDSDLTLVSTLGRRSVGARIVWLLRCGFVLILRSVVIATATTGSKHQGAGTEQGKGQFGHVILHRHDVTLVYPSTAQCGSLVAAHLNKIELCEN